MHDLEAAMRQKACSVFSKKFSMIIILCFFFLKCKQVDQIMGILNIFQEMWFLERSTIKLSSHALFQYI